jgi:hypothetical protein
MLYKPYKISFITLNKIDACRLQKKAESLKKAQHGKIEKLQARFD